MAALKYLALGDSYTIGEGIDGKDSWPVQLVNRLRSSGIEFQSPDVIAQTGWTTGELLQAIERTDLPTDYGLVSLLIGVNNQYRGLSVEEYRREFVQLLELSVSFAAGGRNRVFVLSIPDWSPTPFAAGRDREKIVREIDQFNEVNEFESRRHGVHYFNVTDISRNVSSQPGMLAEDGLHPAGAMYELWMAHVFSFVESFFIS